MFNLAILQVDCPRERGKMGQETNDGNAISLVRKTVAEVWPGRTVYVKA